MHYNFETGLHYVKNRYYSPSLGRFIQTDPLGAFGDSTASGNAYTFGGNSPSARGDSLGLDAADFIGGLFLGVAKAGAMILVGVALFALAVAVPPLRVPLLLLGAGLLVGMYARNVHARLGAGQGAWALVGGVGDVLGTSGIWEGITGRGRLRGETLTDEERGEALGEGAVTLASWFYVGGKFAKAARTRPKTSSVEAGKPVAPRGARATAEFARELERLVKEGVVDERLAEHATLGAAERNGKLFLALNESFGGAGEGVAPVRELAIALAEKYSGTLVSGRGLGFRNMGSVLRGQGSTFKTLGAYHAEWILAMKSNLRGATVWASRPICAVCQAVLRQHGAVLGKPIY